MQAVFSCSYGFCCLSKCPTVPVEVLHKRRSNLELVMPSSDVFRLLLVAEGEFCKHENLITGSKKILNYVHWSTAALTKQLPLPKCNNLAQKLVKAFALLSLRVALKQKNEEWKKEALKQMKCGSRSMAMRAAVATV